MDIGELVTWTEEKVCPGRRVRFVVPKSLLMEMRIMENLDVIQATEQEESVMKKFRVQLDFNAADFDTINAMTKQLGLGTRAELFRSAILAVQWMVRKKEQGYTVVATDLDGRYFEPEFSFLRNVSLMPEKAGAQGATIAQPARTVSI